MEKEEKQKNKSATALREEEVLRGWQEKNIFEKTLAKESPQGEFIFYEGPPTANGRPGIHHLEARAFKDIIPRYKTMQGYHVRRKGGWDTHGLPVELEVEKQLKLSSKKEIEAYGVAAFNQKCQESVWKYVDEWEQFTDRMGYWVDQKKPYVTYHSSYIESVWNILKKVDERKLLYKDYKVLPWCPRCGTALSSHELAQGYQEVTDESVYVKFKVESGQKIGTWTTTDKTYFLVWTTTPWTLPSNLALAVGGDIEYVELTMSDGENIIFAKSRQDSFSFPGSLATPGWKGSDLVGLKYKPLFSFLEGNDKTHQVYAADFVSTEEGTGIVHIAPMYGADDFTLGTDVGLPKKHLVGEDGHFLPEAGKFAGLFFKQADKKVVLDLEEQGLLFKKEPVVHTYPFCWRCKTPLIYYARSSWYIRMSSLRDELLAENKKINWEPGYIKEGRFGEWLKDIKDWAISRERYWGTPLPIWMSAGGEYRVLGSLTELKEKITAQNTYMVMRHGEAESNVANIISSKKENPHHLTERGKEEVSKTITQLQGKGIDLIIASPFVRTKETAEQVAEAIGLSSEALLFDERLGEINTGELNLQPVNEYHKLFNRTLEKFSKAPSGGETLSDVKKRVGELLYEIEEKYKGKKILLITHEYSAWMMTSIAFAWTKHEAALKKDEAEDFILPAECRLLHFVPLPHDEAYSPDLHRPYIDQITFVEDGEEFRRVSEVLDVWFDSGAMPFAEEHYPFENKEYVDVVGYPADFISEAIDQTRGWFYTLHAVGILMGKGQAYKNVICLGHILDKEGKKMSKSVGNTIDPWQAMDTHGADILRLWMYTVNQPGESKNFDEATVVELSRKTSALLLNILSFYELYVGEGLLPEHIPTSAHPLDQWLLSLYAKLQSEVTLHLDNYRVLEAGRAIKEFIGEFSQWYIRRSRDRFKSENESERRGAIETTGFVLLSLAKLLAPFMPFLAEYVYQKLTKGKNKESVHLENWPEIFQRDQEVLVFMETVRAIVGGALALRTTNKIKIRQPLGNLSYELPDSVKPLSSLFETIIAEEVNVKKVTAGTTLEGGTLVSGIRVVLDTTLTPELKKEGALRELTRAIQELRKEKGLKPGELAVLSFSGNEEALLLIKDNLSFVLKTAALSQVDFLESAELGYVDGVYRYHLSL
jgi:isoleucyl-tRNA synthetase